MNILLFSLLLIAGSYQALCEDEHPAMAALKNVKYFDRAPYSHLILRMAGDCQYSSLRNGDTVRLLLSPIHLSSAHAGARFRFFTGLVRSTNIERLGVDSALVTIGLRPDAVCRIEKSDSVSGLLLTLFRDSIRAHARDGAHIWEATRGEHRSVIQPIHTFALNGMAAAENPPAEGRGSDEAWAENPSGLKSMLLSEIRHLPESHLLPMMLSLVSAAFGTVLLLVLSRQRNTMKRRTPTATAGVGFPDVLSTQIGDASGGYGRTEPPPPKVHRQSRENASALDLAKKYGRGLGEINLSLALKTRPRGHRWAQKLEKIADKGSDVHDSASIAKELRVGRGEVDLALAFRHLTSSQTLREEPT